MDEQALIDELYALIRELYRKKQADELTASFAETLAEHPDEAERRSILEYWHDFYLLRKYRRMKQRRRPTLDERLTACSACGYPASHRHHLWDMAKHGENEVTVQLCANCHELHHLMYNALVRNSAYSRKLVLHILYSARVSPSAAQLIMEWVRATIRYEAENGWAEAYRASDAWLEKHLGWSEYLRWAQSVA